MRMRRFSWLALGLLLTGCVATGVGPATLSGDRTGVATRSSRVEAGVRVDRMKEHLGVLSGHQALPGATAIPERGTREGRALTRGYLAGRLTAMGYTVEKHSYRSHGENLFVRLQAETPTDETILLGAHMDSVRNAGANDNGTGTTAVLEAAAVLKGLKGRKVNVIFAWFDEEELGLVGSKAMARDFRKQGLKLTSVHTIDMMGWDSDGDRAVEIERPDGDLWDYYQMVNERHGLNLPLRRTNSGSTDHVAFRAEGFPSVGMCEEWAGGDTTPHYHKRSDAYETIDFEFLASSTRLLVATVGDLAMKVPGPKNVTRMPHHLFPGRDRHFHGEH